VAQQGSAWIGKRAALTFRRDFPPGCRLRAAATQHKSPQQALYKSA
jgi:hypothetical protein